MSPLPQSELIASVAEALQALHDVTPSQSELAKRLGVSLWTLKKLLAEYRVKARPRGGANYAKFALTPELLEEIQRDGVPAVARRLGVADVTIRYHLKKLAEKA